MKAKITYLFLDDEDKARLCKLAYAKQLSVSTASNIIIKHLYMMFNWQDKRSLEYIKKGSNQLCIKIRNEHNYKITCANATNCIYAYFHNEVLPINWDRVNRSIQSEMDKTIDKNNQKNIEIRITWRIRKEMEKWH